MDDGFYECKRFGEPRLAIASRLCARFGLVVVAREREAPHGPCHVLPETGTAATESVPDVRGGRLEWRPAACVSDDAPTPKEHDRGEHEHRGASCDRPLHAR